MAKILYRGTSVPPEPSAVLAGSVAKNSPLTNDEGDWNYKTLDDDIQTRAVKDNPVFTGVVSVGNNIRSSVAGYNVFYSKIDDTIVESGIRIGDYTPNADAQSVTLNVEVIGRIGLSSVTTKAIVSIRSNTLPDVGCSIRVTSDKADTLGLSIEAWKETSTGMIRLFAVPSAQIQTLSMKVESYERSSLNLFRIANTMSTKNTAGMVMINPTDAVTTSGDIIATGDITGGGDIIASGSFIGDGSQLTGIISAGDSIVVSTSGGVAAVKNTTYILTAAGVVITLPATPTLGDEIGFSNMNIRDASINPGLNKINTIDGSMNVNVKFASFRLRFVGGIVGWSLV